MWSRLHSATARFLAMLAISLLGLQPGAMSYGQARGLDFSGFYCGPSGEVPNAAVTRTLSKIARLADEQQPDAPSHSNHCPLCVMAHGMVVPTLSLPAAPAPFGPHFVPVRYEPCFSRHSHGPPLGSRAPPSHI
ncbi:hypothetical protein HY29_04865 [Hyphomonas beringensis]|uniref:DUF2946 domain-containing protein n=1 Tax=Hyphomonas beringensis TaxID=1280946 RepID=A0A062U7K7_9PROT|nr:hypothetical protein HY29_04865 [Hyphomonas beringensis]